MPKITYVEKSGNRREFEVPTGLSVMRGGVDNDVDGIPAECGGACACATCQVLIDPAWESKVPAPGPMEASMIEADSGENGMSRRLSCQIPVTDDLDGLVVIIPQKSL